MTFNLDSIQPSRSHTSIARRVLRKPSDRSDLVLPLLLASHLIHRSRVHSPIIARHYQPPTTFLKSISETVGETLICSSPTNGTINTLQPPRTLRPSATTTHPRSSSVDRSTSRYYLSITHRTQSLDHLRRVPGSPWIITFDHLQVGNPNEKPPSTDSSTSNHHLSPVSHID